jgi:hypothetical protein
MRQQKPTKEQRKEAEKILLEWFIKEKPNLEQVRAVIKKMEDERR